MKKTHPVDHPLHEERTRRAQQIQKNGEWYCPCPDEWLKKEEWSVLTAMLLFAGLNPKWSDLTWNTHGKCAEAKHIERIGWEYSADDAGYALLSKEQLRKNLIFIRKDAEGNLNERRQLMIDFGVNSLEFSLKDCRDNEQYEACRKWLTYYDESEDLLNLFIDNWLEPKGLQYNEFNQRVRSEMAPVRFFLQWAANNDLAKHIPWWDEAIQDGFVDENVTQYITLAETVAQTNLSVPLDTEWCDIKIHFKDFYTLTITIGKKRAIERNFKSFECFYNQKTKKPREGWNHLAALAAYQGDPPRENGITIKHVSDLNRNIKEIFPTIDGKPFMGYKKNAGWKPRVNLSISKNMYHQKQDRS